MTEISAGLNGFYNDKGYYPDKLTDLIPAGWGISTNNEPEKIPKDPKTGRDYSYTITNQKKSFIISTKLDNGVEYFLRGNMGSN